MRAKYPNVLTCLLQFLLLWSSVARSERVIRANALLTCMENSQFSASTFDIVFTPDNRTVAFDVDAITTLEGNFIAKVVIVAYGIDIITETVDFCKLGATSSQLCPLAPGRLTGLKGTQQLSESIVGNIPNIAFAIPNLDGVVRVSVYHSNSTKVPVACVEATLTNDKTVQTSIASWVLAGITIFGFLLAGVAWLRGSLSSSAHIAANIVSLFVYFQSVAIIAMMAVERCPPIAAAWAQNFMWTVGLISMPFMQKIISWYIQSTGGTVTSIIMNKSLMSISIQKRDQIMSFAGEQLGHVYKNIQDPESRLRPFALAARQTAEQLIPRDVAYFMQVPDLRKRALNVADYALKTSSILFARAISDAGTTENGTTDEFLDDYSSKVLVLRGMQRVAFLADIEVTSLFVTGITIFVFLILFTLVVLFFLKLFLEMLATTNVINHGRLTDFKKSWRAIIRGVLLRLYVMAFPSLTVLCLWEFTRHESVATVVLAAFTFTTAILMLGFGCYKTISIARRSMKLHKNHAYILYSDPRVFNRWGFLYVPFRATAYYFVVPSLIYIFLKGLFIAVVQSSGKVQSLCVFIVELAYLVYLSWTKPYMDKTTNGFNIAISAINFVNALFFLFFSNLFGQPAYVSSIMAVVFFVANAVFSLVLVIVILVACIWTILSRNPETRYQPMTDDRESFIPDPQGEKKPITELDALGATVRDGYPSDDVYDVNSTKPASVLGDNFGGTDLQPMDSRVYRDSSAEMVRGSTPYDARGQPESSSSLIPGSNIYGSSRPMTPEVNSPSVYSQNSAAASNSNFPAARLPRSGGNGYNEQSSSSVQEYPGYNDTTSSHPGRSVAQYDPFRPDNYSHSQYSHPNSQQNYDTSYHGYRG